MSDGKLYIVITDKLDATGGDTLLDAEGGAKKSKKQSDLEYAKHRFFNYMESQAKQLVMYNINNVGNFTGDYVAQRKINEAIQGINILVNIGTGVLAGAKYGPWGAVAGAAIAIAGTVSTAALQSYSQYVENKKTNYAINQLRARSGLNINTDGSRGTEN